MAKAKIVIKRWRVRKFKIKGAIVISFEIVKSLKNDYLKICTLRWIQMDLKKGEEKKRKENSSRIGDWLGFFLSATSEGVKTVLVFEFTFELYKKKGKKKRELFYINYFCCFSYSFANVRKFEPKFFERPKNFYDAEFRIAHKRLLIRIRKFFHFG